MTKFRTLIRQLSKNDYIAVKKSLTDSNAEKTAITNSPKYILSFAFSIKTRETAQIELMATKMEFVETLLNNLDNIEIKLFSDSYKIYKI